MQEHQGAVTFKGAPLTLQGTQVAVGQAAPECELVGGDMAPVTLASFRGNAVVLLSVPSLDTPVCDLEVRRFNQEASGLGPGIKVVVVSMDLPFAQKRWCGAAGIENVVTLSDYKEAQFGHRFGLLVKELRLLARAVLGIDAEGTIRYKELVGEITDQPDYDAALAAAREIA